VHSNSNISQHQHLVAATSRSSARKRSLPSSQPGSTKPRVTVANHTRSFTHQTLQTIRSLPRKTPNPRAEKRRPIGLDNAQVRREIGSSCCSSHCTCPRRLYVVPFLPLQCMRQHITNLKRAAASARSSARRRPSPSSQPGSTEPRVAAAKHARSFTHRSLLRRKPNPRGATQRPSCCELFRATGSHTLDQLPWKGAASSGAAPLPLTLAMQTMHRLSCEQKLRCDVSTYSETSIVALR
jgi:hypothetical protein